MEKASREVVIWAKRVSGTPDWCRDNSDGSMEIQEPDVTIQRCHVNNSEFGDYNTSYPLDCGEYELPCDMSWELDREKIKIFDDALGEGAFVIVKKPHIKVKLWL